MKEENEKKKIQWSWKKIKQPPVMISVVAIALAIVVGGTFLLLRGGGFSFGEDGFNFIEPHALEDFRFRHPLTGVRSETEIEHPNVFSIMVENMVESWPQIGLDQAFLVIEAPVEAGIPRFLSFYTEDQEIEKIGPVRSARPYYVDWAQELKSFYAHVGGSNAALDLIASTGTFDLDEFSHGQYFWRSTDRYAPHNVYTSTELMRSAFKLREERGRVPSPLYGLWTFKDDDPTSDEEVDDIVVDFSTPTYRATWEYDSQENDYIRLQAGSQQLMQDGAELRANNVVVMISDVQIIDSIGRRKIKTIGEGDAWIFQDGKKIEGSWEKPSVSERLRFFDGENEIEWNAGSTWIELIPSEEFFVSL